MIKHFMTFFKTTVMRVATAVGMIFIFAPPAHAGSELCEFLNKTWQTKVERYLNAKGYQLDLSKQVNVNYDKRYDICRAKMSFKQNNKRWVRINTSIKTIKNSVQSEFKSYHKSPIYEQLDLKPLELGYYGFFPRGGLSYTAQREYDASFYALKRNMKLYTNLVFIDGGGQLSNSQVNNFSRDVQKKIIRDIAWQMGKDLVRTKRPCEKQDISSLSVSAKKMFKFACKLNFRFSRRSNYPYTSLGFYVKDEDGKTQLIRTGYEVDLYKSLKKRLMNIEVRKALKPSQVFPVTIRAMLEKQRGKDIRRRATINIVDVLLTAHNVTRLLARPEQWDATFPKTDAGQNRFQNDRARAIFQDLYGVKSVDKYPTFAQYMGMRKFDYKQVYGKFFGPGGVYKYYKDASQVNDDWEPAHWNAGIHYYYWIGGMVQWLGNHISAGLGGGRAGAEPIFLYEYWLKTSMGNNRRAMVQLNNGYWEGVKTIKNFQSVLNELQRLDPTLVGN